jgi:hypothetical protein
VARRLRDAIDDPWAIQGLPYVAADGNFIAPVRSDGYATAVSADGSVIAGVFSEYKNFFAYRFTEAKGLEIVGPAASSIVLLSADGRTLIVEDGAIDSMGTGHPRSYRWTEASGRTELCPAGFCSVSFVSGDGDLVYGSDQINPVEFFWDSKHGIRDARTVLTAAGMDLTRWTYFFLHGMTPDKRVFIGTATDAGGNASAFRLVLPDGTFD